MSLGFLLLHSFHAVRFSKTVWLFRLQRSDTGRFIVVNSLFVFVLLAHLAALGRPAMFCSSDLSLTDCVITGQFVTRWKSWNYFVENKPPYNQVISRFAPWLLIFIQAWFFSVTNLQATLTARQTLGSKTSFRHGALLHNFVRTFFEGC